MGHARASAHFRATNNRLLQCPFVTKLYVPLLMTLAGASNYLGAALAVYLFDVQSPWIVAWLRVGAAGIILVAICLLYTSDAADE